jgi:hypothetical protein
MTSNLGSSLGPEISQSLHRPSAMRNLDLAECQLGTKLDSHTVS